MGNSLCGKNIYRFNRAREESRSTVELEKARPAGGASARDVVLAVPRIIVTDDERSYVIFDPRKSVANEEEKKSIMLLGVKISKPKRFLKQKTVMTKSSDEPVLIRAKSKRTSPDMARAAFTQSSIVLNRMRPGSSPASTGRPSRLRAHSLLNMPSKSRNIPYRPSYSEPDSQNLCLKPMATLQVPSPTVQYSPPVVRVEVHRRSSPPVKSPDSGGSGRSVDGKRVAFESETEQKERDQSKTMESEAGPSGKVTTVPKSIQPQSELDDAQPGTSTAGPEGHKAETRRAETGSASDADERKKEL